MATPSNLEEEDVANEDMLQQDELEEEYDSETTASGSDSLSWISWFCSLPGHEYFSEVSEDFIEDDFNLTGLSSLVPFYKEALDMVLDVEPTDADLKVPDVSIVESSAELLYGLVHQRYILTRSGLVSMAAKFDEGHFGYCPRVYCSNARVLPSGRSDMPGVDTVKLFCPSCLDLYTPPSSRFTGVDGSFFGTTFAHLLLHVQKDLADHADSSRLIDNLHAPPKNRVYVPKIYGFRVSERAKSGPRMAWLRQKPKHPSELDKVDGRGRWRELAEDEDEEEDDSDEESSGSEEEEDEQQQQQQAGGQGTAKMSSNKSRSAKKGEAGRVEGPLFEDDVKGPSQGNPLAPPPALSRSHLRRASQAGQDLNYSLPSKRLVGPRAAKRA